MTEPAFLGKELCGSVYANPPSDRVKPLTDDREISREELAVLCATLPAGPSKPVLVEHDVNKQVGVITAMFQAPQSGTTYARFKLYDTPEGRQTHQQIEAGRLRGLSLGTDWKRQPGLNTREVKLRELSVCTEGFRADTGVFNASKDAQASGAVDFVSLPPVNQAVMEQQQQQPQSVPIVAPVPPVMQPMQQQPQPPMQPMQQQQQLQQPMSGSFNATAQPSQNYQYAFPPQQQQQQQQHNPFQSQMPFNTFQSAATQPPSATVPWGQFTQNPAQYFQPQQQHQQQPPKAPNELWHFMNMQQMPSPYGFQQQPMFYPPSQLAPPPYMQQQPLQQSQPQLPTTTSAPAAAPSAAAAAAAVPPPGMAPPGLKTKGKRTASQVSQEEEEADEKSSAGNGEKSDMVTDEKEQPEDKKKAFVAEKKQETDAAAKLLPIPETEAQINSVINAILATPGMSKDDKAANIRALTETHRQLKAMHEEKKRDVLARLDQAEQVLARSGHRNNPIFARLRREADDPAKFKTVIEEANSIIAMLEHNTNQSIAAPLNANAFAAPADGLQAALSEWRNLSSPANVMPQMGTVNASAKAQNNGEPVVPIYTHERPLFDKPLPRIVDPKLGTVNIRG